MNDETKKLIMRTKTIAHNEVIAQKIKNGKYAQLQLVVCGNNAKYSVNTDIRGRQTTDHSTAEEAVAEFESIIL